MKLAPGQWYQSHDNQIIFCIGIKPKIEVLGTYSKYKAVCCDDSGNLMEYTLEGYYWEDEKPDDRNLVKHIPDCDSFDYKPKEEYRIFQSAEEFAPHFQRPISRSYMKNGILHEDSGAYIATAYDDNGIWTGRSFESYSQLFRDGRVFMDDKTPVGVKING